MIALAIVLAAVTAPTVSVDTSLTIHNMPPGEIIPADCPIMEVDGFNNTVKVNSAAELGDVLIATPVNEASGTWTFGDEEIFASPAAEGQPFYESEPVAQNGQSVRTSSSSGPPVFRGTGPYLRTFLKPSNWTGVRVSALLPPDNKLNLPLPAFPGDSAYIYVSP